MLARYKRCSLLVPIVSYEENELFWIRHQVFMCFDEASNRHINLALKFTYAISRASKLICKLLIKVIVYVSEKHASMTCQGMLGEMVNYKKSNCTWSHQKVNQNIKWPYVTYWPFINWPFSNRPFSNWPFINWRFSNWPFSNWPFSNWPFLLNHTKA